MPRFTNAVIPKEEFYRRNTPANLQCFKDPINNLNKGIDILFNHYGEVNANSTSQCKSWLEMTLSERDAWRRGVSAYNGGPGWVTRAIESVRDRRTLVNTDYLTGTHKKINSRYKNDTASWEQLRVYYFAEKLSPGNTTGSGRRLDFTVSNLGPYRGRFRQECGGFFSRYSGNLDPIYQGEKTFFLSLIHPNLLM